MLSFGRTMIKFWNDNKITDADRQWMKRIGDVIRNRDQGLPEVGKYNAGQKYLFWTWVVTILLLFVSGIVMWQPYFTPYFTVGVVRVAVLVHAFSAFVAILGLIVHVYSGVMWVRGSLRAMTQGHGHGIVGQAPSSRLVSQCQQGRKVTAGIIAPGEIAPSSGEPPFLRLPERDLFPDTRRASRQSRRRPRPGRLPAVSGRAGTRPARGTGTGA